MNAVKLLILVSTVTLLGACGGKKSGQPTMVSPKTNAEITEKENGESVFKSVGQCKEIKTDSLEELCTSLVKEIASASTTKGCKENMGIAFRAKCEGDELDIDTTGIDDFLSSLYIGESSTSVASVNQTNTETTTNAPNVTDTVTAVVESEDRQETIVEVNPAQKSDIVVTGGEFVVVSIDVDSPSHQDIPSHGTAPVQVAVDTANDAAAVNTDADDDTVHIVYIPELSDSVSQVELHSRPSIRVTTTENPETRTVETRIEEINENEARHISQRDPNVSLKDQAREKCKQVFKDVWGERPSRTELRECMKTVTVNRVN